MKSDYEKFLKESFSLAEKGKGLVSPNPMVGAVIVKGKRVLGKGFHKSFGLPHAEIEALKEAGSKAKGATLFVNLEPCCHWGKTPPCTTSIISSGIKEVICCMKDPNPLVNGKGFQELEKNGIKVRVGYLEEQAEKFNFPYITYITKKRPYIVLKWAETIDGKIATFTGDSKWITSQDTRDFVKKLRFEFDGIVVGINTILKDNPSLDYIPPSFLTKKALLERKRYFKIIIDTKLKTPIDANIWKNEKSKIIIFTSENTPEEKIKLYINKRCTITKVKEQDGKLDLEEILENLYKMEIGSLIIEGGRKILTSFWEKKLVDKIMVFISGKILGGDKSFSPIGGENLEKISSAKTIEDITFEKLNSEIFIEGKIKF